MLVKYILTEQFCTGKGRFTKTETFYKKSSILTKLCLLETSFSILVVWLGFILFQFWHVKMWILLNDVCQIIFNS